MIEILKRIVPSFILDKIRGRLNLQKILVNTGWLFFEKILRMVIGLLVGVWVARYLGPDQYGLYNYVISFVALFSVFATLGLDRIVLRDITRYPKETNELLGTTFILKLVGGFLVLVLTTTFMCFMRTGEPSTIWMVALIASGNIVQSFNTIDLWFQSQVQSRLTVVAKSCSVIISSALKVLLIIINAPLIAFAVITLIEVSLCSIGLIILYTKQKHMILKWSFSFVQAKKLLGESWVLAVATMSATLYNQMDKVMLGDLSGNSYVGVYSAYITIVNIPTLLLDSFSSSINPMLVRTYSQGKEKFMIMYSKICTHYAYFALWVMLGLIFFGDYLVKIIYGQSYTSSGYLITLLTVGFFIRSIDLLRPNYIVLTGKQRTLFIINVLAALINLCLNYFLIPLYGLDGAALATLVTHCCVHYLFNICFEETRELIPIYNKAIYDVILQKPLIRLLKKV